ncbi:MAG: 30S ribosomal protein S17e [Candidatus Altiarchaeales archaeon]|nr:30S ribosomal protein S17e [Candidatus Altiarchaeales archaeon]
MGRIKQTYLKRVAGKLLKQYPGEFSLAFQHNKERVQKYTDVSSKSMRNKIAGSITRMVKYGQNQP